MAGSASDLLAKYTKPNKGETEAAGANSARGPALSPAADSTGGSQAPGVPPAARGRSGQIFIVHKRSRLQTEPLHTMPSAALARSELPALSGKSPATPPEPLGGGVALPAPKGQGEGRNFASGGAAGVLETRPGAGPGAAQKHWAAAGTFLRRDDSGCGPAVNSSLQTTSSAARPHRAATLRAPRQPRLGVGESPAPRVGVEGGNG